MRLGHRLHPPQPQGSRINDHSSFAFAAASCFCFARKKSGPTAQIKKKTTLRAPPPYLLFISFSVQIFVDGVVVARNNLFVWIDFRVARVVAINICRK